jgi:hypothetical protein
MADYTSSSDVKAQLVDTLGSSTDSSYDALIGTLITSASRAIDGYLGKEDDYFLPSSDGQTRYYDGTNSYYIVIDDFTSISALGVSENGGVASSDYTAYSSSDYFTLPHNAAAKGKPYNAVEIDVVNSTQSAFPNYRKAVRVTGIFGYSTTVPADVSHACMVQVLRYFMRSKNAYQDAGANPAFGQMFYVRELDPDVKTLLHKYVMENL